MAYVNETNKENGTKHVFCLNTVFSLTLSNKRLINTLTDDQRHEAMLRR